MHHNDYYADEFLQYNKKLNLLNYTMFAVLLFYFKIFIVN